MKLPYENGKQQGTEMARISYAFKKHVVQLNKAFASIDRLITKWDDSIAKQSTTDRLKYYREVMANAMNGNVSAINTINHLQVPQVVGTNVVWRVI
jgi:beta-glucosidase/6-phospho-beta-glucosidase/beta-galactosidase